MLSTACDEQHGEVPDNGTNVHDQWLVQKSRVLDGGPGWDGIPNLVNPETVPIDQINFLDENELVIGINTTEGYRAYPHRILDWHEIINVKEGVQQYVLNYCPLTGSGMAWDRFIDGKLRTYGASGLLYNSNLIMFDDRTESLWSQMLMLSINGENMGLEPELYPVVETTWSTWKALYPDSEVVSLNTGYDWPYHLYPYIDPLTKLDYRTDPFLMFPVTNKDTRLHNKERVLGVVIKGNTRVYRFDAFEGGLSIIQDELDGIKVVVTGSKDLQIMTVFNRVLADGTELQFEALPTDALPAVIKDNEGNTWGLFGNALSGDRMGEQLPYINSFMGYWFAWGAFYPDTEIYE